MAPENFSKFRCSMRKISLKWSCQHFQKNDRCLPRHRLSLHLPVHQLFGETHLNNGDGQLRWRDGAVGEGLHGVYHLFLSVVNISQFSWYFSSLSFVFFWASLISPISRKRHRMRVSAVAGLENCGIGSGSIYSLSLLKRERKSFFLFWQTLSYQWYIIYDCSLELLNFLKRINLIILWGVIK